jgi:GNAT superfamily N-acetyltransferase
LTATHAIRDIEKPMTTAVRNFKPIVITSAHGREFEEFYAIYKEALPSSERKSRADVEKIPGRADYRLIGIEEDSAIIAFAILFLSTKRPLALLEYMATAQGHRNKGLGAHLFKLALEAAAQRVVLIEADSEREHSADNGIRIRRKEFYFRQGCAQIDGLDYRMPMVGSGSPPVMDLLLHPNGQHVELDVTTVRTWLETIYTEVYARPKNDVAIRQMIENYAPGKRSRKWS